MNLNLRRTKLEDYELLYELASLCKPLELHDKYTYWVILSYFNDVSFILEDNKKPIGFITGLYNEDTGFIWQIGIIPEYRQKNFSNLLIDAVCLSFRYKNLNNIEVTIAKDNKNSFYAFNNYCNKNGLKLIEVGQALNEIKYRLGDFNE